MNTLKFETTIDSGLEKTLKTGGSEHDETPRQAFQNGSGRAWLDSHPELVVLESVGKLTGKPMFMIEGVEMGWAGSAEEAGDVARRLDKWGKTQEALAKGKSKSEDKSRERQACDAAA